MKLRGFHSKSSSSTASSTAAIGEAKIADIPAAAPGDEQRLALRGREVEELREERADRAARHDDRALRAERPARADRDRGGDGLQDRDLRLDPAAADQDRLERLGDAVAADLLRAEARHQADDERAHDRDEDAPTAPR